MRKFLRHYQKIKQKNQRIGVTKNNKKNLISKENIKKIIFKKKFLCTFFCSKKTKVF